MSKFRLGQIFMTRGVAEAMADNLDFGAFVAESFRRYVDCDWGDLTDDDKALNDSAVKNNDDRILGAYKCKGPKHWKVWIITEHDRSYTTILFPDEY